MSPEFFRNTTMVYQKVYSNKLMSHEITVITKINLYGLETDVKDNETKSFKVAYKTTDKRVRYQKMNVNCNDKRCLSEKNCRSLTV